VFAMNTGLFVY